jgi:hypothetical protein
MTNVTPFRTNQTLVKPYDQVVTDRKLASQVNGRNKNIVADDLSQV